MGFKCSDYLRVVVKVAGAFGNSTETLGAFRDLKIWM